MVKSGSKIGILGGTFDPVHDGHLALARAARDQLKLDRVYMVLSPLSPFKLDKEITPVAERLAMLGLALEKEKDILIGEWELRRKGPSYTVNTLSDYKKNNPKHDLYLILGSDAMAGLDKWKSPQRILTLATVVVGRRPGMPLKVSNLEGRMFFLRGTFPPVSSTEIRRNIAKFPKAPGVPAAVAQFIRTNHLYEH